ncbi:MAG: hypothetical protein AAFQ42_11105 [Pseudomonadota bacterium]
MRIFIFVVAMMLGTMTGAAAQDACTQLRQGSAELDSERAKLCAEYPGTCSFLAAAEKELQKCSGEACAGPLMVAVGGCALVIGWEHCNYVAQRFSAMQSRRVRIQTIAKTHSCLLF